MTARLHIILHVPKCAGSTIEVHLARHLGPRRFWRPPKRTRQLPLELFRRKYDAWPPGPPEEIAAVSGHFIGKSIEALFPGRQFVRSVILRNPEQMMMSFYNYRMMRYIAQGQKAYPFTLHMRAFPCDPMANFLLERWLEMPLTRVVLLDRVKKAALLDEALAAFDRIVDIAQANDLAAWHSRDLGIPEAAERTNTAEKWERQTGWKSLRLGDLTGAERAELHDRLALDRYLWRRWALGENVALECRPRTLELYSELVRPGYEIGRRMARALG